MPLHIDLNFDGIEPYQGPAFIRVAPDTYSYTVATAEVTTSTTGNSMVRVALLLTGHGYTNMHLFDRFVLEGPGASFGRAGLRALFESAGVAPPSSSLDAIEHQIRKLIGAAGVCVVDDDLLEARAQYPARVVSRVVEYLPHGSASPAQKSGANHADEAERKGEMAGDDVGGTPEHAAGDHCEPQNTVVPTHEYVFIDTAIGGVQNRNHVMTTADFKSLLAGLTDPIDVYATFCAFASDFPKYVASNLSPKTGKPSVAGYSGPAYAKFLPLDVDAESDLPRALADTQKLVEHLRVRWGIVDPSVFFSGSKGFSIQIPGGLFGDFEPGVDVAERLGRLVDALLDGCVVGALDRGIYQNLRLWRVPNTRHGGSGLFKIRLSVEELVTLDADAIRALAVSPRSRS